MVVTNTLAYYSMELYMKVNSFIIQAHGPHVIVIFEGMKNKITFSKWSDRKFRIARASTNVIKLFFFVATVHSLSIFLTKKL
jgi:hypothetical protein